MALKNNRNVLQIWVLINSLRHRLWLSAPKFHSVFFFFSTCQSDTVVNGRHLSHCKKRHFARIRSAKWLKKSFSTVRILCFVFTSLKTSLSLTQLVGQNKTFEVVIVARFLHVNDTINVHKDVDFTSNPSETPLINSLIHWPCYASFAY